MPPHIVSIVIDRLACESSRSVAILAVADTAVESSEVPGTTKETGFATRARRLGRGRIALVALGLSTAIACGRDGRDRDRDGTSGGEDARLEREDCLGQGHDERGVDVDGNGTADVTDVFDGDRRLCTAMDMNFDGHVDLTRFYAEDGEATRLELHDFDFDRRVDEIALFEGGQRVRAEIDTDFDDRMDLFMWCEDGQATRVQRRRIRRDRVDTWETYEAGVLEEAKYDEDGDGEPDRFEHYREGRLHTEEIDRNSDGEISADERSEIEVEFAGVAQRLSCDRNAVDAAERLRREARAAEEGGGAP